MSEIKEVLSKNAFKFNKRYGQNFITDTNLLSAIVADAGITDGDTVLEIGPGAGTLTAELAKAAKKVVAYEIDENLRPVLAETLADFPNAEVIFKDATKATDEEIAEKTGYSCPEHFCTEYKKYMGMTAREYRKRLLGTDLAHFER